VCFIGETNSSTPYLRLSDLRVTLNIRRLMLPHAIHIVKCKYQPDDEKKLKKIAKVKPLTKKDLPAVVEILLTNCR
jgi:hypothetical protein